MRPDLHINQKNPQTSVEDLLNTAFNKGEDLQTKVLHQKEVSFNKRVFLSVINYRFSSGARLHTQSTKGAGWGEKAGGSARGV